MISEFEIKQKLELAEEQIKNDFYRFASDAFGDSVPETFKKQFADAALKNFKENKTITQDFIDAVEEHLFEKGVLSGAAKLIKPKSNFFKMLDKETSIRVIKQLRKFHSDFVNKQLDDLKQIAIEIEKYGHYIKMLNNQAKLFSVRNNKYIVFNQIEYLKELVELTEIQLEAEENKFFLFKNKNYIEALENKIDEYNTEIGVYTKMIDDYEIKIDKYIDNINKIENKILVIIEGEKKE